MDIGTAILTNDFAESSPAGSPAENQDDDIGTEQVQLPPPLTKEDYLKEMNEKDTEVATIELKLSVMADRRAMLQYNIKKVNETNEIIADEDDEDDPLLHATAQQNEVERALINRIYAENKEKVPITLNFLG